MSAQKTLQRTVETIELKQLDICCIFIAIHSLLEGVLLKYHQYIIKLMSIERYFNAL